MFDLPVRWQPTDHVTIIDAAAPDGRPGHVAVIDALAHRLESPTSVSTHTIDVGAAIELARAIDRMPATLTIIGIEGARFEHGATLSAEVQHAAGRVVTRLCRRPPPE